MLDLAHAKSHVQLVAHIRDLVATPFSGQINAMCYPRELSGDFAEIVNKIPFSENLLEIDEDDLLDLKLSPEGEIARDTLINDLQLLRASGTAPSLNLIKHYEKDQELAFFPTDVYSYHVDRSPVPTDTYLCTYHGAASDFLPNAAVTQKILIPEIKAELLKLYEGPEEGFEAFLTENFFDLHYQALPNARPINLGQGNLWKLAVDHPESQVLPCVHRAPAEIDGKTRLMLIC